MQSQTFRSIYSTDDPEKIRPTGSHVSPAEAVIKDLVLRKTPLEDLMSGLEEIGNKQALSIIEKGKLSLSHGLKHIYGNGFFWDFDRISLQSKSPTDVHLYSK